MENLICLQIAVPSNAQVGEGGQLDRLHLQQQAEIVEILEDDVGIGILGNGDQAARLAEQRRSFMRVSCRLVEKRHRLHPLDHRVKPRRRCAEVVRCAEHDRIRLHHLLKHVHHIIVDGAAIELRRAVGLVADDAAGMAVKIRGIDEFRNHILILL